jgi:hypothetical protein
MPQENLDALKRLYAGWALGSWSDTSIFDPHVVGVFPDPTPRWVKRTATGRGSGVQLEDHQSIHVWTFRGRRAIRMELFEQESAALEAVGLRE